MIFFMIGKLAQKVFTNGKIETVQPRTIENNLPVIAGTVLAEEKKWLMSDCQRQYSVVAAFVCVKVRARSTFMLVECDAGGPATLDGVIAGVPANQRIREGVER